MGLVFIIFGLIVLASFITGIILTRIEKKKEASQSLNDDPRILFSVDEDKAVVVSDSKEEVVPKVENIDNGFSLPTNSEYNINKFVVQEALPVVQKQEVTVSNPSINSEVKTNENTKENKMSESRFVPYDDKDEELI